MYCKLSHFTNRLLLHLAAGLKQTLPEQRAFRLKAQMYNLAGADIHSTARICSSVTIVYQNVHIGRDTFVGAETYLHANENSHIHIGDRVDIAPRVIIITGSHEIGDTRRRAGPGFAESIYVGDGCWLGTGATILHGTYLGKGTVVAAGSVVRGQFGPNVLIGGTPAKLLRELI